MNGGPIERCPICGYDLRMLPKTHRCPECGFEYEASMRVWIVRFPKKAAISSSVSFLIFGVPLVTFLFQNVALSLVILFFVVMANIRSYIRGFIVIGLKGVTFKFARRRVEFRTWDQIKASGSFWILDVFGKKPKHPSFFPVEYLKEDERKALREEFEKRIGTPQSDCSILLESSQDRAAST